MKRSIGLITLNAKFIHSSLGLRYLRNASRNAGYQNVWIREFVINQPIWKIAAEIQKLNPEVLGVGIYIWNRSQSLELIERLQKQIPHLKIAVGGPEVSFENENSFPYPVISGEGEKKWLEFLELIRKDEAPSQEVLTRWRTYGADLPELILPYLKEDFPQLKNRIVYFETSRGCPYLCSFCLSALDKTVRYFDEASIRSQIQELITAGIKKIKFVDRTFNLKPARMKELMQWLTQFNGNEFHFEVVGDILTTDILDFLATVPPGMFQFEIGIQTTTESVQETIQRKQNNAKLFETIRQLVEQDRIHFHCDLIFGLPGETLDDIWQSFSRVMALRPHELQLGFLKFLPGAPINKLVEQEKYLYHSTPPYELISHKNLSAEEVLYLKQFEDIFDRYYNSKRFRFSINYLLEKMDPKTLFCSLLNYHDTHGLLMNPVSLDEYYRIFQDTFYPVPTPMEQDLLKLDYLYAQRSFRLPEYLSPKSHGKTWKKDRKTPVIPFNHEIEICGSRAILKVAANTVYYAISHSQNGDGYFR
ncbi:MAG: B12-binding domain-containing radical SAM protein, partial [Nitrospinae bacterium]|nr:B12-binding domain-containing radical SAM protein [Nitrospinota bacterium]